MNNLSILPWFAAYMKSGAWKKSVIALSAALTLTAAFTLGLASCAQTTNPQATAESAQPDAVQAANSRDAADLTAAAVGTESGGSGMEMGDALTLAAGHGINGGKLKPESDTTTVHVVTVSHSKSKGGYGYSGTWTHTWTFEQADGTPMPKFVKGVTDKVVITSRGEHTISTPRVGIADSSIGSWVISNRSPTRQR